MERRHPLNDEEITRLAACLIEQIHCQKGCPFSEDDMDSLKSMIKIRKGSVKLVLYVGAALLLLALKDIYDAGAFIVRHLTVVKP